MDIDLIKSKNGLRLLTVFDKDSPSCEIGVYFKVGSRYDPINKSGLAHILEHMNFQGTTKRKNNRNIVLEIENLGASIDAFTSYEYTGYTIKSPKNNITKSLDVMFDMISNSVFENRKLEKEKNVIIEEIKMYEDIPLEKAREALQEALFKGNNLGKNIAGDKKDLSRINVEDLYEFRKAAYTESNLLLTLSGCFNDQIKKILLDKVEKLAGKKGAKYASFQPNQEVPKRVVNYHRNILQSNVNIGYYGVGENYKYNYAIQLGNIILSGGMGSILYQKVREDMRLVYYINSSHSSFNEVGSFQVEFGVDPSKTEKAIQAVYNCLENFADGKVRKSDFIRARNYYLGIAVTQLENAMDIASWNVNKLLYQDKFVETKEDILKSIENIELSNVVEIWKQILKNKSSIVVNVGPKYLK